MPPASRTMHLSGAALPDGSRTAGGSRLQYLEAATSRRRPCNRSSRIVQPIHATMSGDQRGPAPGVRRFPGSQLAPGSNLNGSVVGGNRTGVHLLGRQDAGSVAHIHALWSGRSASRVGDFRICGKTRVSLGRGSRMTALSRTVAQRGSVNAGGHALRTLSLRR